MNRPGATRPGPRLRVVGADGRHRMPAVPEPIQVIEAELLPSLYPATLSIEVWEDRDAPEGALPLRLSPGARLSLIVRPRPDA